jgi:hypothetical protein
VLLCAAVHGQTQVADLLLDRYSFGLSCLLPQDLEVRPGRLYRWAGGA